MARIRSIKPEFFDHEHLCSLSFAHRLCFVGLWTQADKAGRMEDRPLRLKARIFPFDDVDMEELLADLAAEGFIVRYESDGGRYVAIPEASWKEHQRPRKDELESVLPPIPSTVTDSVLRSDDSVPSACDSVAHKSVGGMRNEVGGREEEQSVSPEPPDGDSEPADDDPPYAVFPVVGAGGPEWSLRSRQVDSWRELYPTVDVEAEIRKALAWVAANGNRRKTGRGMPAFLVNWLNRATNRGGFSSAAATPRGHSEFEVKRYEEWVRKMGGCGHTPHCSTRAECMGLFVTRLRGAA